MATGITDIRFKDLGPVNPAQTDRITGIVWLNERLKGKYPKKYWEFIIAHEEGHIIGNNRSEFVADEHASSKFFSAHPDKPFDSVDALKKVLPMNTEDHKKRVHLQEQRAAKFDCNNNGNQNSCRLVQKTEPKMNFTGTTLNIPAYKMRQSRFGIMPSTMGITSIDIIELVTGNTQPNKSIGITNIDIIEVNDGADYATQKVFFTNGAGGNISNFIEGSGCKPGQYACIKSERMRIESENQLKESEALSNSLKYGQDLDYKKSVATLLALEQSDKAKQELALLQYDLELKKLEAAKKPPIDSKKMAMVGLIAAAALLVIFFLNTNE